MLSAVETLYGLVLLLILLFSLGQLSLLLIYLFRRVDRPPQPVPFSADDPTLPTLTIQLPIYNERYVVDRLIDAIAALHYPAGKVQIQLLDDSTDDTTARIAQKVQQYQQLGRSFEHVRRPHRTGYKAGALAYGLREARGEFIAIFDADFLPDPLFLLRVLPSFTSPDTAVVQTRWLHLNESHSLLTRLQAMGLNAHFLVEQNARCAGGLFLNFNGTAGIWRKAAILDAGGWQADTLTEDLDLSYRAQLRGWHIIYRDDVGVPAELPVMMGAIKSQQYRWMKGPAECARKHLRAVLKAPGVSLGVKMQACFHLLNSSLFVLILTMALLSVPVLYGHRTQPVDAETDRMAVLFSLSSLVSLAFWGIPFLLDKKQQQRISVQLSGRPMRNGLQFLWLYPLFLAVMLGLSLHNSLAVLEGHLGIRTPFVRTPKFNVSPGSDGWVSNTYGRPAVSGLLWFELALAVYFTVGVGLGIRQQDYSMISFHGLLAFGFALVAGYSLVHTWRLTGVPGRAR